MPIADDLKLSPETAALAALAGRVVNASLDKGLTGDLDAFDAEVDAAIAKARPAFSDEDAARRAEMLALTKRAMRIQAETARACREGRTDEAARLDAEFRADPGTGSRPFR